MAFTELGPVLHRVVEGPIGPLHSIDYGGSGQPIVCLHGVTGSAWGWYDVAAALAPRRVIALDMRGHGDSVWSPSGAYDTADHVSDLEKQLDAIELEQITLVGSSWGALVALEYCVHNPNRVGQLAIVDIEPSFEAGVEDVPARPRQFDTYEDALAWVQEANPRAPRSAANALTYGGFAPNVAGQIVPKHDPFFFEYWPFRSGDHWETLTKLTCPTLFVHAGFTFVQGDVMQRMHETVPGSRLVQIAESGHVIPVDNPEALASELIGFLGD